MGVSDLAARRAALKLIRRSLAESEPLSEAALGDAAPQVRAEALRLARAVFRHLGHADLAVDALSQRPAKGPVRDILRLGAVEIKALGRAPHGVVDAAVRLAKSDRRAQGAAGMVNAVLRKLADGPGWEGANPMAGVPKWLGQRLKADWGKPVARAIAAAHLAEPPLDLTTRPGAAAPEGERTPSGSLRLAAPGRVSALAGFEAGGWWAQDAAAALPARLAGQGEGRRALDLCAAPGGKTMQLAAMGWRVTALDASEARLAVLKANLARTGLSAEVVAADAVAWDGPQFDLVLLDAPCSATGTIRRHPELPWIRDGEAIATLAETQARLLDAAWARVAPGGRLIYCVCSLAKAEGEERAEAFLAAHPNARRSPVAAEEIGEPDFIDERGDLRTRPDQWAEIGGVDGFFAARFVRDA